MRLRSIAFLLLAVLLAACSDILQPDPKSPSFALTVDPTPNPVQVYGAWHCGNDFCTWGAERTPADFDSMNRWLVDRGDGQPSVNLVVLSFVHPYRLLKKTTDGQTLNGIPRGMTPAIVDYFKSRGIRVQLSIGGITYTSAWNQALAENATQLGLNAAAVAGQMGVGFEIDYEESKKADTVGVQRFIDAYRSVHPYDASGSNHAARLTIDLAAGSRWLIGLTTKAARDWLRTDRPVLDYANAMVTARQSTASGYIADWQEHVDGKPQYQPPIVPMAPSKFTGSLYIADGGKAIPECNNYAKSLQSATRNYVESVLPKGAGNTAGMLGFMFWAAERPSSRGIGTVPPNSCEKGVGTGASQMNVTVPMPVLRTQ